MRALLLAVKAGGIFDALSRFGNVEIRRYDKEDYTVEISLNRPWVDRLSKGQGSDRRELSIAWGGPVSSSTEAALRCLQRLIERADIKDEEFPGIVES